MVSMGQKCEPQAKNQQAKTLQIFSSTLDPKISERGRHKCMSWREENGKSHVKNAYVQFHFSCEFPSSFQPFQHFSVPSRLR